MMREVVDGNRWIPRRIGRPSKFTPLVRRRILKAIRRGNHFHIACAAAGIGYSTFREWCNRFPEFAEAVERAQAQAERRLVSLWAHAATTDWRAAKELLARRHPDRWGPKAEVTVTEGPANPPDLEFDRLDAKAAMRLLRRERERVEQEEREKREAAERSIVPSPSLPGLPPGSMRLLR